MISIYFEQWETLVELFGQHLNQNRLCAGAAGVRVFATSKAVWLPEGSNDRVRAGCAGEARGSSGFEMSESLLLYTVYKTSYASNLARLFTSRPAQNPAAHLTSLYLPILQVGDDASKAINRLEIPMATSAAFLLLKVGHHQLAVWQAWAQHLR